MLHCLNAARGIQNLECSLMRCPEEVRCSRDASSSFRVVSIFAVLDHGRHGLRVAGATELQYAHEGGSACRARTTSSTKLRFSLMELMHGTEDQDDNESEEPSQEDKASRVECWPCLSDFCNTEAPFCVESWSPFSSMLGPRPRVSLSSCVVCMPHLYFGYRLLGLLES